MLTIVGLSKMPLLVFDLQIVSFEHAKEPYFDLSTMLLIIQLVGSGQPLFKHRPHPFLAKIGLNHTDFSERSKFESIVFIEGPKCQL